MVSGKGFPETPSIWRWFPYSLMNATAPDAKGVSEVAVEQLKDSEALRALIDEGKRKGVLTYDEINDTLSHQEELDAEQVDDILQTFADEGIRVVEKSREFPETIPGGVAVEPDALTRGPVEPAPEDIAAVEVLPLDDSVRMWLREIGKTPLLTNKEEISLNPTNWVPEAGSKYSKSRPEGVLVILLPQSIPIWE